MNQTSKMLQLLKDGPATDRKATQAGITNPRRQVALIRAQGRDVSIQKHTEKKREYKLL